MKLKPERRVGWHAHKGPAKKRERCVPAEHGKEKREYVLSYKWGEMKTMAGQNRWPRGAAERTFKSDFVESQLLFFFLSVKTIFANVNNSLPKRENHRAEAP